MITPKKIVYLIDGNAYIHRAYHAIAPLSNQTGLPTHAVFGFVNILLRVIREKNPEFLAIAFDAKGPTFRHAMYAEYKSNRSAMPEDLVVQIPYIKEIVQAYGITTLELAGVEADDLLATAAMALAKNGLQVVVVSGDKDLLQLVSSDINIWDPMLDRIMDVAAVEKKYQVPPLLLTDLFALIGDSSDNIPGVMGIGPKTAEKLLNSYGSLDQLYSQIATVTPPKLQEKLVTGREQAFLSRELVRLKDDLEIPLTLEKYRLPSPDHTKLKELYTFLNFTRLLQSEIPQAALSRQHFNLIQDEAALTALTTLLNQASLLVLDTETTGLDTLTAGLVGLSLCVSPEHSFYIPLAHRRPDGQIEAGQLPMAMVLERLRPYLQDSKLPKIAHNFKFDYAILSNHGVPLQGPLWDTMIASYLLDPSRRSHKLDLLVADCLNHTMTSFTEVTNNDPRPDAFAYVSPAAAKDYSCEDAYATYLLWELFHPQLKELGLWPLFTEIEMALLPTLLEMEQTGIKVDPAVLIALSAEFGHQLAELNQQIYQLAGEEFNTNSSQQLAAILFDKLGLPQGRKTKTGFSTDAKVLEKLALIHPLPRAIGEYRNIAKLKSTYVDSLVTLIHPRTGRLHTSFNQTVAATGRLSSSEPNLQNIPIRTPEGQRIRAAFVPEAGHLLIGGDYSQIDLRILAHYAQDQALLAAFREHADIHTETAAEIFQINPTFVTNQMRRVAKSINFGIVYGMSAFGLANQLNISRKEAATFIERYFRHYRGVQEFMAAIIKKAQADGFVTTLFGRRRPLPDINSPNKTIREFAERTALNTPIQGTAADIIKLATIKVHQELRGAGLQAKLLLQIHDELILEAPTEEAEATMALLKKTMESAAQLDVPLVVNVASGTTLAEL